MLKDFNLIIHSKNKKIFLYYNYKNGNKVKDELIITKKQINQIKSIYPVFKKTIKEIAFNAISYCYSSVNDVRDIILNIINKINKYMKNFELLAKLDYVVYDKEEIKNCLKMINKVNNYLKNRDIIYQVKYSLFMDPENCQPTFTYKIDMPYLDIDDYLNESELLLKYEVSLNLNINYQFCILT